MNEKRHISWCLPKEEFETSTKQIEEIGLEGYGFKREHFYDAHELIRSIAFDPSGSCLCIGSGKGQLEIFDTMNEEINKEETLFPKFVGHQYHQKSILDIAYSLDGGCIATSSNDKTVQLIDIRNLSCKYRASYYHNIEIKPQHILQNENSIKCLHFPSCLQLLTGESGQCNMKIWDLTKHKVSACWSEHTNSITAIQSNDDIIVSGGIDKKIVVWDPKQESPVKIIKRYPSRVNDIKLIKYPSDYYVIAAYEDSAIICYSLAKGNIVWQCVTHQTSCNKLSLSTDDKLIAASSIGGQITINTAQTGKLLSSLYEKQGNVTIEWNPKQAMFANATHKGHINLWHCNL